MKTNIMSLVTAVSLAALTSAYADEQLTANTKTKTFSGILTAVDAKEKTVTVKKFWFDKTFNLADKCEFLDGDKKEARLSDLRPGQKVAVSYKNASGVLVANRIAQEKLLYSGTVREIDLNKHTLTVRGLGASKTFAIPAGCKVVLKDEKEGKLDDIKVGHKVTLVYEAPTGSPVLREIEQKSATFVGTLDAVDVSARTVKAKHLLGNKKFNLADGCAIVLEGKPDAQLSDLKIGQKFAFSYDEVDGVNVVNRIAQVEGTAKTEVSQAAGAAEQAQK
jgi:Cu/Ag efflux protein CusF